MPVTTKLRKNIITKVTLCARCTERDVVDKRNVRAERRSQHVGFAEASEIRREDRNAAERGFNAHEPKWFRPQRGHEQDACVRVDLLVDQLVRYGGNDADVGHGFPTRGSCDARN